MNDLKKYMRKYIPDGIFNVLSHYWFKFRMHETKKNHLKEIERLRGKATIKVLFLVSYPAIWKYKNLYNYLSGSERYNPFVLIIPTFLKENDELTDMAKAYDFFFEHGYNVIKSYNEEDNSWLDIRKVIDPEIVFFTFPYHYTRPEYRIENFLDKLTCYTPYTFQINNKVHLHYDMFFQNALWRFFYQTPIHREIAQNTARNRGVNGVITGYPGLDDFLFNQKKRLPKKGAKKQVIWAPHHTIEGFGTDLNFSNFTTLCNFFLELVDHYQDEIFFTFKPHPFLKNRLYNSEGWGKKKTDEYYRQWKESEYCDCNESSYEELFWKSDAMIHDCDSFMAEYISLNKPSLYTRKDDIVTVRMNEFGKLVYRVHYHASGKKDILDFIERVVLGEDDYLKDERKVFIDKYLLPPNNQTASKNIFDEIEQHLFGLPVLDKAG